MYKLYYVRGGAEHYLQTATRDQVIEAINDTTYTEFVLRENGNLVAKLSREAMISYCRRG